MGSISPPHRTNNASVWFGYIENTLFAEDDQASIKRAQCHFFISSCLPYAIGTYDIKKHQPGLFGGSQFLPLGSKKPSSAPLKLRQH